MIFYVYDEQRSIPVEFILDDVGTATVFMILLYTHQWQYCNFTFNRVPPLIIARL